MQVNPDRSRQVSASPFWGALFLVVLLSGSIWLVEHHLRVAALVDATSPDGAQSPQMQNVPEKPEPGETR